MTIREIQTRAGSLSSYGGYLFLLFCWYFAFNRFESLGPQIPESPLVSLVDWGVRILVAPFLLAGVYGGIYAEQQAGAEWGSGGFLKNARGLYGRMLGANLLYLALALSSTLAFSTIFYFAGTGLDQDMLWVGLLSIPFSALSLFLFAGVALERRVWGGLFGSLRTLVLNPFALAIGLVWGLISFADNAGMEYLGWTPSLALDAARAVVLAAARILAVSYALSLYRPGRAGPVDEAPAAAALPETAGMGWVRASFGLAFVSFLPLVHFAVLGLGIFALQRSRRFTVKAAVAVCLGAFFTVYYVLLAVGWMAGGFGRPAAPPYTFLSEVNPRLGPQATLLEAGSYQDVLQELERTVSFTPARHWSFETALALAKAQANDLDGSLEAFRAAADQNPERSEFYYYYGVALLQSGRPELALQQFHTALEHAPRLADAQRYVDLIEGGYRPSTAVSALSFVVILLVLFTLHEYGHAYAAWKLGDDTAARQGRLTLNPIPHLDLFGSIVLPGILLLQEAGVVFGWAKPVPVNPENFRNPQRDHMRVSFAGPAMNFLVSMICLLLLGGILLAVRLIWPESLSLSLADPYAATSLVGPPFAAALVPLVYFLKQLFYTSLVLGVFNLIPVPPLDGSWIFSGLLPQGLRSAFEKIRPYAFVLFLLLVVTSAVDYLLVVPVSLAWGVLQLLVSAMGFG